MKNTLTYDDFIVRWTEHEPTDQLGRNETVREGLRLAGDDGTAVRDVRHYLYKSDGGKAASSLRVMKRKLKPFGFDIYPTVTEPGLVLTHDSEIASAKFDALTIRLEQLADANGWLYDGWEALRVSNLRARLNSAPRMLH